ncbi:MAG: hypothetical protein CMLOHMNK_02398 [Steroidobacteraceae bacterium]|nr:hypothetical protein [Steroidobacteraceae bacterium]
MFRVPPIRLALLTGLLAASAAHATVYPLPEDGAALFGSVEHIVTTYEDTLIDLGRRYSLGYEEILRVNPGVDPWLPGEGTAVLLPGQRILPSGPRDGIVVNLPEHRLYYYPKPKKGEHPVVYTYPVSIGKMDWRTPLGKTRIVAKDKNPIWYPPASVRKEHAERGDPLPAAVPPGPDNPLGAYKMRLAIGGGSYLIHGTNNPAAVGMAITHGCIRMFPEDIEQLFAMVPVGTNVYLVNEPVKVAIVHGEVYMESHPPVDAEGQVAPIDPNDFAARLDKALGPTRTAVHWDYALDMLNKGTGMPVLIGIEADDAPAPSAPVAADDPPAAPGA